MDQLKTPNGWTEITQTFGDIKSYIGPGLRLSPKWEQDMLVEVQLPAPVPIGKGAGGIVTRARIHHLIKSQFYDALSAVHDAGLWHLMNSWGGTFEYRLKRTSGHISLHSLGIAVDINPEENSLGSIGKIDPQIVTAFRVHGWFWGGDFQHIKDPMHFQYATGY